MRRKSLRKLAGCIVIELVCALGAFAADYEYKAGYAAFGHAKAVALEDRRGQHAIIVAAAFGIPLSVADSVAALAIKQYNLERASLLIYSVASGDPLPADARTAIDAAFTDLRPSTLVYGNGRLTVSAYDGRCRIAISAEASLDACTTPVGDSIRGVIRSAFRLVDVPHALQSRNEAPRGSVAVQAIAVGPVVLFSGPSNVAQPGRRVILAVTPAVDNDPQLNAAVGEVFLRVGGRPK